MGQDLVRVSQVVIVFMLRAGKIGVPAGYDLTCIQYALCLVKGVDLTRRLTSAVIELHPSLAHAFDLIYVGCRELQDGQPLKTYCNGKY